MHSASTKTLLTLSLIVLLAMLALLGYEVYAIRQGGIESTNLATQVAENTQGSQVLENLRAIQVNSSTQISMLDKLAVSKDTLVPFLELLEQTGKTLNLKTKVTGVSQDQTRDASTNLSKLHVTFEATGSWTDTLTLAHALESLPYQVMIDQVNLTTDLAAADAPPSDQVWHSTYTLSLYSFQ